MGWELQINKKKKLTEKNEMFLIFLIDKIFRNLITSSDNENLGKEDPPHRAGDPVNRYSCPVQRVIWWSFFRFEMVWTLPTMDHQQKGGMLFLGLFLKTWAWAPLGIWDLEPPVTWLWPCRHGKKRRKVHDWPCGQSYLSTWTVHLITIMWANTNAYFP